MSLEPGRTNLGGNEDISKLISLGEIVSKVVEIVDDGGIDPARKERFECLIADVTEKIRSRNVVKTEKAVKSILIDILLYDETRADFIIKNEINAAAHHASHR